MSRFGDWRARRRSASRRTAPTARSRPASNGVPPPTMLAPTRGSHLSDGVVVQTHLVARLLGMRILRVDGVVHLAPARLEPLDAVPLRPALEPPVTLEPPSVRSVRSAGSVSTARSAYSARSARSAAADAEPPVAIGAGLLHASELIQDGDRRLR
jgi:hypothetical protein